MCRGLRTSTDDAAGVTAAPDKNVFSVLNAGRGADSGERAAEIGERLSGPGG
jgi:hypothetical protein